MFKATNSAFLKLMSLKMLLLLFEFMVNFHKLSVRHIYSKKKNTFSPENAI